MGLHGKITTAKNMIRQYGYLGLLKGIANKIKGKDLLEDVTELKRKERESSSHRRKIVTASNLYRQYGLNGLYKGIVNKLKGRELLAGFRVPQEPVIENCMSAVVGSNPSLFDATRYLTGEPQEHICRELYSCTVIVPIYNGLEHLKRLFPSIVKNTPADIEVILVNDCSPDPQIRTFINVYLKENPNWKLIENEKNYGFVKTVNRGMTLVQTDYAILLNTDTEVPRNWIPKMITPFLENEKIATTTPFTNSGVYFSFPKFGVDNQVKWDLEEINEAFDRIAYDEYGLNEIHSGTGFCMGINMACWKEIGELDYENFGKGYGEENDWCFRAVNNGWRHLLVPNLYVHHFHGGSFLSEEKRRLCEEHAAILERKYFQIIHETVPVFQQKDPWKVYRIAAAIQMCADNAVLYVNIKSQTGDISGAIDYSNKKIKELQKQDGRIIIAQYERGTKTWSIIPYSVDSQMEIPLDDVMDLELLFDVVTIKKVIITNLAFCENTEKAVITFSRLRKMKKFELVYEFHDYLSVCPSFFLINSEHKPCDPLLGECKDCIRKSCTKAVRRDYIAGWRRTFNDFFDVVDHCQFFSDYTKGIVCRVYPQVISKCCVDYHKPLLNGHESKYIRPADSSKEGKWRIAFVGNFCMEKGSEYYLAMKEKFSKMNIDAEFIVIGENNTGVLLNDVRVLGSYRRENLGRLLTDNRIHFVLYPSINNETFSYVAQELMILQVPFVIFPCGAPQERIKNEHYELARVAEEVSLDSLYEATNNLVKDVYLRTLC